MNLRARPNRMSRLIRAGKKYQTSQMVCEIIINTVKQKLFTKLVIILAEQSQKSNKKVPLPDWKGCLEQFSSWQNLPAPIASIHVYRPIVVNF